MRTSRFYSPLHPAKIVDHVTELVSLFYYENNLNETCNIFSQLYKNNIIIQGTINSNDHPTDYELLSYIKDNINCDYNINLNLIKSNFVKNCSKSLGTFIGYATTETIDYLPFEHYYSKELVKTIYQNYNIPIVCQLTINGNDVLISLEHNFKNSLDIESIISDIYKSKINKTVNNIDFVHSNINYDKLYDSGKYLIYNHYGPRVPYGDISYVGSSVLSNNRLSILNARTLAIDYLTKNDLKYSLVEISYGGDQEPVQIGIKGNTTGINIENGTFFTYGTFDEISRIEDNLILNKETITNYIHWGI